MSKKKGGVAQVAEIRVKNLPIRSLVEPDYNNRTITDAALQGLSQSLTDFGLVTLPVVNVKGGRNVVVGGNQRVRILREAGEETVPCVVVEMDADTAQLANFALNNTEIRGEFVPHLVKEVMDRLREATGEGHEDLFKRLRFDVLYRSTMRNLSIGTVKGGERSQSARGRVEDDDTPQLSRTAPESRVGAVYQLGEHRLYCGRISKPGSLDAFGLKGSNMLFSRFAQPERFKEQYLDLYLAHGLQNCGGVAYLATSFEHLAQVQYRFIALGGHWSNLLVAYHSTDGRKGELYRDVTLPVLYGWHRDVTHFFYGGRDKSNLVMLGAAPLKGDVPVELALFAMQNSSQPGEVVLDVHVAQGATVIAAEKAGRKLVGYVQSPREMDRVRHRWSRFVHGDKVDWRKKTGEVA